MAVSKFSSASAANDFNVNIGSVYSVINFTQEYPSGAYSFTSAQLDVTMDVYVYNALGTLVGYTNGKGLIASGGFNKMVIIGGTVSDVLSFTYKTTFTSTAATSEVTAGPVILSVNPQSLPNINSSTTVTGLNFATDIAATFTGTDNLVRNAKSVVRGSTTSLVVTRPDSMPTTYSPYILTVTNPSVAYQPTGSNANTISVTSGVNPVWSTTTLPLININNSYSATVVASDSDGGSSLTYSIVSGSLPTGLFLSSAGAITGTATTGGLFSFTVRATDSGGNYSDQSLSIGVISGGTLSSDSTYFYRTFIANGNFTTGSLSADVLQIAGGGGGGNGSDGGGMGGGGAGGVLLTSTTLSGGTHAVVIGGGGAGATGGSSGNNQSGTNTSFGALTQAVGGGYGNATANGSANNYGGPGGSGGGGGGNASSPGGIGGTATSGQGNIGGTGGNTSSGAGYKGGGGGGAGARGQNIGETSTYVCQAGGSGTNTYSAWLTAITSSMTGVAGWATATSGGYIAGGGGGAGIWSGWNFAIAGGPAGAGGGGKGGDVSASSGSVGQSGGIGILNTGGGGGAGAYNSTTGGTGGSGLVVVRYLKTAVYA